MTFLVSYSLQSNQTGINMSLRSRDLCPSNAEPTELDVNVLDQITVADLSDQEALDDFLNSTSDTTTTESSLHSGSPTIIISRIQ